MSNDGSGSEQAEARTIALTTADAPRASYSIDDAEHVAAVVRVRTSLVVGAIAWTSAIAIDFMVANAFAPRSFGALITLRAIGCIVSAGAWAFLKAPAVSPGALRLLTVFIFGLASALFGAMSIAIGNIGSPYFSGVMVMLLVYAPVASAPWRRGAIDASVPVLAYVATLFTAARVSPTIALQFRDVVARTSFFVCVTNLLLAYAVVVASGHAAWGLRRQVFASRSLGRYKLKRLLGAGGMGEVWLAHHGALKRDVAIKVMRRDRAHESPHAAARFEREARATSELTHPNTIRIFDYGLTDDGVWYYAMELLEGEDLGALVARSGPMSIGRAIRLVEQAARALAEAHAKGIVHRDIKPANLFVVTGDGVRDFLKVLDFGIAKVPFTGQGDKLTQTGHVIGTPTWMAPETFLGAAVDARADIYSLGAVLYFALTGHSPFADEAERARVDATLPKAYVSLGERMGEALPNEVEEVVARCLDPDRDARFQTADDLANALARCEGAERQRRERA